MADSMKRGSLLVGLGMVVTCGLAGWVSYALLRPMVVQREHGDMVPEVGSESLGQEVDAENGPVGEDRIETNMAGERRSGGRGSGGHRVKNASQLARTTVPSPSDQLRKTAKECGITEVELDKLVTVSTELGVSDVALCIVLTAEAKARKSRREGDAGLAAVQALGSEGVRALVCLVRVGREGTSVEQLFDAFNDAWPAQVETTLMEAAEDESIPVQGRHLLIAALGNADTPRVREYLVDRGLREESDSLFLAALGALKNLGEPRITLVCERALHRPGVRLLRAAALRALGETGGAEAKSILVDYLGEASSDCVALAVLELRKLDADAARQAASSILASRQAQSLQAEDLEVLNRIVRDAGKAEESPR